MLLNVQCKGNLCCLRRQRVSLLNSARVEGLRSVTALKLATDELRLSWSSSSFGVVCRPSKGLQSDFISREFFRSNFQFHAWQEMNVETDVLWASGLWFRWRFSRWIPFWRASIGARNYMKRLVFTAVTADHLARDTMVDLPCIHQLHQRRFLIVLHFSNNDQCQFTTRLCRIVCAMPGSWWADSAMVLESCTLKSTQWAETKKKS